MKDWKEDFEHENGMYQNICRECNSTFIGHKRRFVCKECSTQKLVNVDQRVMLNFADIKKEFEERFCFSYMENGEKMINDFMWKTSDNTMNVWEWFEQKLKEASKISA